MKDAQKPDHVSLNTLINYLRDGRYVIPDFQREFEWKPWDILDGQQRLTAIYYAFLAPDIPLPGMRHPASTMSIPKR